jgi:predicted butyrate kinase (DUF1464 family)
MPRVVGTDPGTSSLDLLLLVDGEVADQIRLTPEALRDDPGALSDVLRRWAPVDLVAGPSGYGLPLVRAEDVTEEAIDLMALVRPDERGADVGILGFRRWVRALLGAGMPAVFLPGGIHLPTIPEHRKANAIDLGTADKVAVVALALWADARATGGRPSDSTFAVVELGSAFSAVLVVEGGRLVDASAGTRGPIGVRCGGAWDGEVAVALSPLSKADLFRGGLEDLGSVGPAALRESLIKHVAGLRAVTAFDRVYLSGAAADRPEIAALADDALARFGRVVRLPVLPGARVKHAAQGAALLADGLAGGRHAVLVESLQLRGASGTARDHIRVRPGPAENPPCEPDGGTAG